MDFTRQMTLSNPTHFRHKEVTIIGAGGIGAMTTLLMAKCGFEHITVYDFDILAIENGPSQMLPLSASDRVKENLFYGAFKVHVLAHLVYDMTLTTSRDGGYANFGGTSGATPIVAGFLGLSLEMYTDGLFGDLTNPLTQRFENRPHFTTSKALLINTANQYPFKGQEHDLTRVHQGWGFPSVKNMYDQRKNMLVVNEDFALKNLESKSFPVKVEDGRGELKITMTYADPVGSVSSAVNRVNNLDLKVTSPDGQVYWGNFGLRDGNYSTPGGTPDVVDTVENVFVLQPKAGDWTIEVIASEVVIDGHVETPEVDADFALVATGISR